MPRLTDAEYAERLQRVSRAVADELGQAATRGAGGEVPDWVLTTVSTGHKRLTEALDPNKEGT